MESFTDNFHLTQTNIAFVSRSKNIFSCLDSIEAKHNAYENNRRDNRSDFLKPDPAEEPVLCKPTFKMPKSAPKRCRIPDYKVRPEKWKMYNLSDVSSDQLSDKSNKMTALAFLESIKIKNGSFSEDAQEMQDVEEENNVNKFVFASTKQHHFKKPAKRTKEVDSKAEDMKKEISAISVTQPNEDDEANNDDGGECREATNSVRFRSRRHKDRNANIRPKTSVNDDEEQDLDVKQPMITQNMETHESDNDEFGDNTSENDDCDTNATDEFGAAWSSLHSKEQPKVNAEDYSDDEDVLRRAKEFAALDRSHTSSCFIVTQDKDMENDFSNCEKESLDDLDDVD